MCARVRVAISIYENRSTSDFFEDSYDLLCQNWTHQQRKICGKSKCRTFSNVFSEHIDTDTDTDTRSDTGTGTDTDTQTQAQTQAQAQTQTQTQAQTQTQTQTQTQIQIQTQT